MDKLVENYLSISSIWQLLLAIPGLFCAWFWGAALRGIRRPHDRDLSHGTQYFSSSPMYRQLFRIHKSIVIRALSFSLATWPFMIAFQVFSSLINNGYAPYNLIQWKCLFVCFGIALAVFWATMRNQGLALKMDQLLSVSWDKNDSLAFHLNKNQVNYLSTELILELVASIEKHRVTLRGWGIDSPFVIESWLLAPTISSRDPAMQAFRNTLATPYLNRLFSSHVARHLRFISILLWLIVKSPLICYRLHQLPKPAVEPKNGLFRTRHTASIEAAVDTLKLRWDLKALPLSRMRTFSVIALVAHTPKVIIAINGWSACVKLEVLPDIELGTPLA